MGLDQVRAYYDRNTRSFLRYGQGGSVGAIHRAVWGPGVQNRVEAFRFIEHRLLEAIDALEPKPEIPRVLDLGCGVGTSLAYLATQNSISGIGVTISPVQVELANARLDAANLAPGVRVVEASYTNLPQTIADIDFAYAIESFALGPDPAAFFAEAARVIRPGGKLAVCDDFLDGDRAARANAKERRWLEEFRRGGCAASLLPYSEVKALASSAGFELEEEEDLTGYLELRRPRDRLITAVVAITRHLPLNQPFWSNLLGGNALQMALMRRLIRFRLVRWRRRSTSPPR